MARLKACHICGKIHDASIKCKRADMRTDREHHLRQTNRWHAKSLQIRERSNWLCSVCRDQGIINHESLEVHHIEKIRDNPEKFLDDDNLICLCTKHHKQAEDGLIEPDHLRHLAQLRDNYQ